MIKVKRHNISKMVASVLFFTVIFTQLFAGYRTTAFAAGEDKTLLYSRNFDDGNTQGMEKVIGGSAAFSATNGALQAETTGAAIKLNYLESDKMKVAINENFPSIVQYEWKNQGSANSVIYGQEDAINSVKINGTSYQPTISFNKTAAQKAAYTMSFNEINVVMDAEIEVSGNILDFGIKNIRENGTIKVSTIEIPNHNLLSVRSTQNGAALAGARMYTAVSGSGDVFVPLTGTPAVNNSPIGYMYAFLNTDQLSAGVWTNSVYDNPSGSKAQENFRVQKQTVLKDGYYCTGIWSGAWTYRVAGMADPEPVLPGVKIAITPDANEDGTVDWQDGAIAFRSIMNNPLGADRIPELVVQRIPMNFGSQATNPFLKVLDETKRVYLATDGLGQNVLLKGYGSEGHDSAHPDYGVIGRRQGGAEDMNTLINTGAKYNADFGVHINATESYTEAKAFNEQLVDPAKPGWNWLDPSYYIRTHDDATSGTRLARLNELKSQTPNLRFIYLDVWYRDGWESRKVAREINSMGWRLETEFPNTLEYDNTWNHWAVDKKYGGTNIKGYNSNIVRFIRNHQKDTWIAGHLLLGGAEMADYEGWQGRTNFDDMIKMTFNTDLPTKYMQHFPIIKWTDNTIKFENNVTVSNATGTRVITKDGKEVLKGNAYLLPWEPVTEAKLYHWNADGGTTTWDIPNSWNGVTGVKLYKLSDQGRQLAGELKVTNGQITITADANTPYVVYKNSTTAQQEVNWGEGTQLKDPGFNSGTLSSWTVTGEGASVERNTRGQYELKIGSSNGAIVSQQLTGLSEGTYSASVNVEVSGKRRAAIGIKDYGGAEAANFTDSSIAKNYIDADSKHDTNMQRMRVFFDVPAGKTTATLYLKVDAGADAVTFDDVRIVKTQRTHNPTKAYFIEDFENIDQGLFPFVKGEAGGSNDPRTHLSELHAPYTQKGWNKNVIDDVISGNWSLKVHEEESGIVLKTIPQNLRFIPGKTYRVSFKYESAKSGAYSFVIGDGADELSSKPITFADTPKVFTKEFEAGSSGESWIGIKCINGSNADFVLDELMVEEIPYLTPEATEITPVDLSILPRSEMTATATSEMYFNDTDKYMASDAIDGDPQTYWLTDSWDPDKGKLPQSITVSLGKQYEIDKVVVLPGPADDYGSEQQGSITKYELYVSSDGTNYTKVASGDWSYGEEYKDRAAKTIEFQKQNAAYIKLTALEGSEGYASLAEISVYKITPAILGAKQPVEVKTLAGRPPKLPETLTAQLGDGTEVTLPVSWAAVPRDNYLKVGSFTVEGDINNSGVKVIANITVKEAGFFRIEVDPQFKVTTIEKGQETSSKITKLKGSEGKFINASIHVKNGQQTASDVVIIAVSYNQAGAMLASAANHASIGASQTVVLEAGILASSNVAKIKVFVLDGTGYKGIYAGMNYIPLTEPAVLE